MLNDLRVDSFISMVVVIILWFAYFVFFVMRMNAHIYERNILLEIFLTFGMAYLLLWIIPSVLLTSFCFVYDSFEAWRALFMRNFILFFVLTTIIGGLTLMKVDKLMSKVIYTSQSFGAERKVY